MKADIRISSLAKALKVLSKIKSDIFIDVTGDIVTLIKSIEETTVKTFIDAHSYENGQMILPIETAELIKKLKDGQLALSNSEISTSNKTIRFDEIMIAENFTDNLTWEEAFQTTEKEIHRMLEVKYAVAQDETRPVLCGVYFNSSETCALDGYRLSLRKGNYNSNKSFVVNKNTIEILDSILDAGVNRKVTVYCTDEKVKFSIGSDVEIIGNTLAGEFIKYRSIIPDEYNCISKMNLKNLKEELNFLSNIKTNYLKLGFTKDKIIITADQCREEYDETASKKRTQMLQEEANKAYKEKYNNWAEKKAKAESKKKPFKTKCPVEKIIRPQKVYNLIPVAEITSKVDCNTKYDLETFDINVNYKYLNEALKTYADDAEFKMRSCVSPIVITNDDENLELVLPLRVRGD